MLPNKEKWRKVFTGDASFGSTLLVGIIDFYGTECFNWAPETLMAELEDDLGIAMPSSNFNKLMAAKELVISDAFYDAASVFNFLCNGLNGVEITNFFDFADSHDISWGVVEALIINTPDRDPIFSEEVKLFINMVLQEEGILTPPDIILDAVLDIEEYDNSVEAFSDDPEMYQAINEVAANKTEALSQFIQQNFMLLIKQLGELPLSSGNAQNYLRLFSETA